jgi:7-cyano-7-deazaguanine reductase
MSNAPSDYEGRQEQVRDWDLPTIETFHNIYADKDFEVTMSVPEFTCVCPKTGLPDFATLTLVYMPDRLCLELKSFKEYLLAYRARGIFHENVVNRVLDDVVQTARPRSARLTGVFNPRGGIQTTVVREYRPKTGRD